MSASSRICIYRLALLAREDLIDAEAVLPLLDQLRAPEGANGESGAGLDAAVGQWLAAVRPLPGAVYDAALAAFERPLFAAVLRETGGNQLRAAQLLGINRNTLRKRLGELEIDPDAFARRS